MFAYVELEKAPRMLTNIVERDVATLEIGHALELVFHRTVDGNALAPLTPA